MNLPPAGKRPARGDVLLRDGGLDGRHGRRGPSGTLGRPRRALEVIPWRAKDSRLALGNIVVTAESRDVSGARLGLPTVIVATEALDPTSAGHWLRAIVIAATFADTIGYIDPV